MSDTKTVTLTFIRHDRMQVDRAVAMTLTAPGASSPEDTLKRLTAAGRQWVETTEEGQEAWDYSCEDLNIGDLDSCGAFSDEGYLGCLAAQGLGFVSLLDLDGGIVPYDSVLA